MHKMGVLNEKRCNINNFGLQVEYLGSNICQKLILFFVLFGTNKTKMTTIINPEFESTTNNFMHIVNALKCNCSKNVELFIRTGTKYVFEFPETNEIVNVVCTGKGFRAADMMIKSHVIDGIVNPDEEEYTFSYQYDSYDKINFASFSYKQTVNVYISFNDLVT
jgi:hypothetical protein